MVYVLYWDVAKLVEGSDVRREKHADIDAVSPGYMAPEQVLGMPIVSATEVFALGAMLYEIVTSERAFEDADVPSILRRCTIGLDAPPSRRNPRVPSAFDAVVVRCLAQPPTDRPSAPDVGDAIEQIALWEAAERKEPAWPSRRAPTRSRRTPRAISRTPRPRSRARSAVSSTTCARAHGQVLSLRGI